jgi:two-component system sensor histidine kinase/response regulator
MGRDNAQSQHAVMPGLMTVSGNNLTCRAFLEAVATAAGRTQARPETVKSLSSKLVANAPSREEAKQRGGLILIAEDNETNQKVILRQLALLGHAADVAADGRQALEYWKSGDYALLLTDLHMPKMDGYELAEAIRSAEKGDKRIPIVALTANALKEEAQRCRAVGMDDYRSKPTPLAELKVVLDKWLPATGSDAFASRSSTQSHGSVHGTVIAMPQRLRNVDATNTKTESDQHSSAERTHLRSLV